MDIEVYGRFLVALIFVVGLILGVAWALRRFGPGALQAAGGARRKRRLALIESLAVDARRRLVLVSRDGREHLLLIGGGTDLLVESGIAAGAADAQGEPE
ncbi:MAG: FliO/MopB family protein [Alphaproteobacteria bacterium]|nr:FliO/MopB family protein [Alphaproteobacteria bacterium]